MLRRLRATASRGFGGGGGGGSGFDPRRGGGGGGGGFDDGEEEEGGGGGGGVPGPARRGWTYKRGDVVRTKEEQSVRDMRNAHSHVCCYFFSFFSRVQARRREAQQRWKILCLVRTFHGADGVDEETRRERLRNRVDDWMAGFAARLKISKDDALDTERSGEGSSATLTAATAATAMHLLPERKSRDSGLGSGGGGGGRDTASSPLLLLPSQPHYLNYLNNGNIGQANHRSNLLLPPPPPPLPRGGGGGGGGGGLPLLYSSLRRSSELRQDSARERREFESEQRERIRARADREREKNRCGTN